MVLEGREPTFKHFISMDFKNLLTWVGLRFIPVNSSLLYTASFIVAGGFFSKYFLILSLRDSNSLLGRYKLIFFIFLFRLLDHLEDKLVRYLARFLLTDKFFGAVSFDSLTKELPS